MAWEENSRICLPMQLIAILSRIGVGIGSLVCQSINLIIAIGFNCLRSRFHFSTK